MCEWEVVFVGSCDSAAGFMNAIANVAGLWFYDNTGVDFWDFSYSDLLCDCAANCRQCWVRRCGSGYVVEAGPGFPYHIWVEGVMPPQVRADYDSRE